MPLIATLLMFAASGTAATADLGSEPDARRMSPSQIRANNAGLAHNHPYYIRCLSHDETGSLVKKVRSCRTNRQWKLAFEQGNQDARDTYEAMTTKSVNSN